MMSILATMRGIPQLYYGSEIGMRGDKGKGDADIRRDFPGGWKNDPQNAFNPQERTAEQKAYFEVTSKLFNWRKNQSVIHHGKLLQYLPVNEVYVYFRYDDNQTIMVVINNKQEAQTIDLQRFAQGIKSFTKGKDVVSEKEFSLTQPLKIDGKTALVLELK